MRHVLACLLLATIGCYEKSDSFVNPVGGLSVSASNTSIPADGFSTVRIIARIDDQTRVADRVVTFTTNVGTFVGAAATTPSTLSTNADGSGVAIADLRSSSNIETATVTVKVGTATPLIQLITISFTAINPGNVLRLSTSASVVPADGVTLTQLIADISPAATGTQRNVAFRTTNGKFSNDTRDITVTASSTNRAVADLRSEDFVGTARITATAGGVTAETTVTFEPALPDFIVMDVSKAVMTAAEEITVTAALKRSPGTVTSGRIVTFQATNAAGASVGLFRNVNPSGPNGAATAVFSPAGATGLVTIRAATPGRQGTAAGEVTVRIN